MIHNFYECPECSACWDNFEPPPGVCPECKATCEPCLVTDDGGSFEFDLSNDLKQMFDAPYLSAGIELPSEEDPVEVLTSMLLTVCSWLARLGLAAACCGLIWWLL